MKLLDETRHRGQRTFRLMAETEKDRHVLNEIGRILREHPVLRAAIEHDVRDKFPSLRLEEIA